jgi:hypothetical protein
MDKRMKIKTLAVIIEYEGKVHQVLLNQQQESAVLDLVLSLHDGRIKCLEEALPLELKTVEK